MTTSLLRTPLYGEYAKLGGKTIDFGGWDLPVQFSSIKEEHEAVRTRAGLFDVSHMGEITVKGPDSLPYLQRLVTNDVSKLADGQAQYTAMCYEDGGTVDDLLIYRLQENDYLLVVNASNTEKDFNWMKEQASGNVSIDNVSDAYGQIAVQGPLAEAIVQRLTEEDLSAIKFFRFRDGVKLDGRAVLVSRTGYTGEDGFEIYGAPTDIVHLWTKILEEGADEGIVPCGLGSRDTLRFEACLPLYGQELTKDITPLEAGIGFTVKLAKGEFVGRERLAEQKESGAPRKSVGLEMEGKGIPRSHYPVKKDGRAIGEVTSGTQIPTTKRNLGLALIDREFAEEGTDVMIEIRGKEVPAKVVATPFYKRQK